MILERFGSLDYILATVKVYESIMNIFKVVDLNIISSE